MEYGRNSESLGHDEHELFVSNARYLAAKTGVEVCATYIQQELEGKCSIATLEKYVEEYAKWSQELKNANQAMVDCIPMGELESIVRDCIDFCRPHKRIERAARRLIKQRQPQHTRTHTGDKIRAEESGSIVSNYNFRGLNGSGRGGTTAKQSVLSITSTRGGIDGS